MGLKQHKFLKWVCFLLTLIQLHACNVDKTKKVEAEELDFSTDDSSELFFKNVRQSDYAVEENREAGVFLYRNKKWSASAYKMFDLVIVFNWRQDRAYLLIEWGEELKDLSEITVVSETDEELQKIIYAEGNTREQLAFLTTIYNGLLDGADIRFQRGGVEKPMFGSDELRELYRLIMYDYYRLTGVF